MLVYTIKFRMTDQEYIDQIGSSTTDVSIDYYQSEDRTIRNILVKRGHDRLFILLHGSPSSSAQWVPLVNDTLLRKEVDFLLIDRPGYGFSDFGNPVLNLEQEAKLVYQVVEQYAKNYSQLLMLGTSYGGSVTARFMMDHPGYLDASVLMSSSVAPGEERIYGISWVMDKVPWLFPKLLIVANQEKLTHERELKKMLPYWDRIATPVMFIHSTGDDLIYPSNVSFALDHMDAKWVMDTIWVKNGEHSLYWSNRNLVFNQLYDFIRTQTEWDDRPLADQAQ